MSMSDYAIEQEEAMYDECVGQAEQDHFNEMEYSHQREQRAKENHTRDDDNIQNLVDEYLENKTEKIDTHLFWEVMQ